MEIYRAPGRAGGYWKKTDERSLAEFAQDWKPYSQLRIDATINKDGERHTAIGLQFSANDVASLTVALLAHYQAEEAEAQNEREAMSTLLREVTRIAQARKKRRADHSRLLAEIEALVAEHWSPHYGIK